MIRVFIVDDHPVVRSGLKGLLSLSAQLQVVGEASSGTEAIEQLAQLEVDVVLCDLRLGAGLDGVDVIEAVQEFPNPPKVLILTTYDNDSDIARAVMAGASGYLLKDALPETIVDAIDDAAAGALVLTPDLEARMTDRIVQGIPKLSSREIDVLRIVAQGRSNREIAKELFVTEATVKTHLVHAFSKLGAESRTEAVALARKHGFI
ncbi:response regulator [Arcanobacterium bovis]|uniref:Response regulator transcription factor n=1 Tax=Arcanobacterium bovis TaxID=2529275 RepID=A0A4Q9V1K7_9ACTO|nr:response regulator transcription factor [Arcanobacterium bovis]TBW22986.1 response regulator transcription factor [Arcanobacterium bovis]